MTTRLYRKRSDDELQTLANELQSYVAAPPAHEFGLCHYFMRKGLRRINLDFIYPLVDSKEHNPKDRWGRP